MTLAGLACAAALSAQPAASAPVAVTMSVSTVTTLSVTGCPVGARQIGSIPPGSTGITSSDCTVSFSSNLASRLRLYQEDRTGSALWTWTNGTPDTTWNAAPAGAEILAGLGDGYGGLVGAPGGEVYKGGQTTGVSLGVARFTTGGALDTGWNGDGFAQVPVGTSAWPQDVTMDATGRLLIVGKATIGTEKVVLGRMLATGAPDTVGFGGGDAFVDFDPDPASTYTVPSSIIAAADGTIWVSGCVSNTAAVPCMRSNGTKLFVAHITSAGLMDTSYGTGGIWLHDPPGVTSNGMLVPSMEGGFFLLGRDGTGMVVVKLRPDGTPDPAFGTAGVSQVAVPGATPPTPWGAIHLADGKLLVQGDLALGTMWIVRLTATGGLDTSWGDGLDGGFVPDPFPGGGEWADAGRMLPTGDGGAFIAGTYDAGSGNYPYYLAKFTAAGTLDLTFGGGDGLATIPAANSETQRGGMAASDGRVYVGGGTGEIHVLRYGGDGQQIPDYVHPGTNFASAGGAFGVCLRTSTLATPTWAPGPALSCDGDGAHWNGVARTPSAAGAEIATMAATVPPATVSLRFGVRPPSNAKGSFIAPITFELVAP